jgi:hypothetical protein
MLIVATIALSGCLGPKDCKADISCLLEAAKSCQAATADIPTFGSSMHAEVKGCEGDRVLYSLGTMNCKIPKEYIGQDFSSIPTGLYCSTDGSPAPDAQGIINDALNSIPEVNVPPALQQPEPEAAPVPHPTPPVVAEATPANAVSIIASLDDWAWSYRPDTNRHSDGNLGARYKTTNGERAEPVIMFDLSSLAGKDIASAELRLYTQTIQTAPEERSIYSATDDAFTEGELTWNKSPQSVSLLSTALVSSPNTWYSWDVTSFVKEKAGGKATLRMVSQTGYPGDNSVGFYDRESEHPPTLVATLAGGGAKKAAVFGFEYASGSETLTAANKAGDKLKGMGYETQVYSNKGAKEAQSLMTNADVIVIAGHGIEYPDPARSDVYGGGMIFYDGTKDTYLSPMRSEAKNYYSLFDAGMSRTKFVLFLGCDTGLNSGPLGQLTDAAVNNGAKSAAGFTTEVTVAMAGSWAETFFDELSQGRTVKEAFDNSANRLLSAGNLQLPCPLSNYCWTRDYQISGDENVKLV